MCIHITLSLYTLYWDSEVAWEHRNLFFLFYIWFCPPLFMVLLWWHVCLLVLFTLQCPWHHLLPSRKRSTEGDQQHQIVKKIFLYQKITLYNTQCFLLINTIWVCIYFRMNSHWAPVMLIYFTFVLFCFFGCAGAFFSEWNMLLKM